MSPTSCLLVVLLVVICTRSKLNRWYLYMSIFYICMCRTYPSIPCNTCIWINIYIYIYVPTLCDHHLFSNLQLLLCDFSLYHMPFLAKKPMGNVKTCLPKRRMICFDFFFFFPLPSLCLRHSLSTWTVCDVINLTRLNIL